LTEEDPHGESLIKDLRTRTISGLVWSGIEHIGQQLMTFIISVILARLLTPEDFGLIGMIIIFTGFAQLFTDMGFGSALIQKSDLEDRHLNSVFWANVATGFALTLIIIAVAPFIASFYNVPMLQPLTAVIALSIFITSLKVVQDALLHKYMDFRQLAIIQSVAVLVSGSIAIAMAFTGYGVWSLVIQSLFFTSISVVMMWQLSPWRPAFSLQKSALKDLIRYSSNLLGANIFNYWVRNSDDLLIARFIGSFALGIYSRAYTLMLLPLTQITDIITRVMFPALSSIQNDKEQVKNIYLRSISIISLVTYPLMIGLLVTSKPFILVVFGEKWAGVIPILQIFCLIGLSQSIDTTVGWIFLSQGRTDVMFKWGVFAGIVTVMSFIIGLQWGIIGVALAYLIGNIILWYPEWYIAGRIIELTVKEIIFKLAPTFSGAVAMGLAVAVLGLVFPASWSQLALLAVQVSFGAAVYLLLVHFFHVEAYEYSRGLVREYLGTRQMFQKT
jgi:O-antigen/teichoic acid export membrane protein